MIADMSTEDADMAP